MLCLLFFLTLLYIRVDYPRQNQWQIVGVFSGGDHPTKVLVHGGSGSDQDLFYGWWVRGPSSEPRVEVSRWSESGRSLPGSVPVFPRRDLGRTPVDETTQGSRGRGPPVHSTTRTDPAVRERTGCGRVGGERVSQSGFVTET